MKVTYTREMLEHYKASKSAETEASNYREAGMSEEEIRADIEECLEDYEFEYPEDRDEYIGLILEAVKGE